MLVIRYKLAKFCTKFALDSLFFVGNGAIDEAFNSVTQIFKYTLCRIEFIRIGRLLIALNRTAVIGWTAMASGAVPNERFNACL